jgi:branched-chain amino acid transport system substrate-binding protein
MRDLKWSTPQGVKTMRGGDHQAMQDMYAIIVKTGKFEIQSRVSAADAIGPDVCTKF